MLKKKQREINKGKESEKRKHNAPNKYERCAIKWPETRWVTSFISRWASSPGAGKERRACNLHRKSRCEMLIGGDDICGSPWRSNLKAFPCENRARNGARSIFCGTKTENLFSRSFLVCVQTSPALFWGEVGGRGGTQARSLSLLLNRMETLATQAKWRLVKTSNKHTLLNWNYCSNVHRGERTKVA